jgi:hypothetical protein
MVIATGLAMLASCSRSDAESSEDATVLVSATNNQTTTSIDPPSTEPPTIPGLPVTIPAWLYTRPLPTDSNGIASSQPTPLELIDRKLPPQDLLPLPTTLDFKATINPLDGEPLARSTWHEGCPVHSDDLRYVQVTFWGFDERPHLGEMILHKDVSLDIVQVFRQIYEDRFPIEEMRIITTADLDADPTGDGNISASFVCRAVTGGTKFSQHAYGLAVDINPFHNPYIKGERLLPELSTAYIDRTQELDGMMDSDSVPVQAFLDIGWGWGGNWNTLKDYQHFSQNNR